MAVSGVVEERGSPRQHFKALGTIVRESLKDTAEEWWETMMPGHFQRGARNRYRYAGRTVEYSRWKGKRLGHQQDLVKSGESERAAKQSVRLTARAVKKTYITSKAVMKLPRHFYMRPNKINLPDELVRTTGLEDKWLGESYRNRIVSRLNEVRPFERRKIAA